MTKSRIALAVVMAGLTIGVAAPAAYAQSIQIGPGGVTVDPDGRRDRSYRDDRREERRGISSREATRIARSNGMADVNEVGERRGTWVVRGDDRRGRGMVITISSRTGEIIDIDRERGRF